MTASTFAGAARSAPDEPAPSAGPQAPSPDCLDNALCDLIYRETGVSWLADTSFYLLVKPLRILLIVAVALVLRQLVHRLIRKLTSAATEGRRTGPMRPLRRQVPAPPQPSAGLRSERRRQRAEALGSVLRSVGSVTIFTVAAMLIMAEFGFQLAPLIASAGIVGLALGFGAQNLVKDFLAGLFMLLEDQYGVGDVVDVGEASGTVETIGLRITTIRDVRGVVWYIRNGEIVRVGNKSRGWALVVVDVPVGFAGVDEATSVLRGAAASLIDEPAFATDLLEAPQVLGVEEITADGAVVRTTAKTTSEAQWRVGRELRRRLTEALEVAGITRQISAGRIFVRPHTPAEAARGEPTDDGVGGPT